MPRPKPTSGASVLIPDAQAPQPQGLTPNCALPGVGAYYSRHNQSLALAAQEAFPVRWSGRGHTHPTPVDLALPHVVIRLPAQTMLHVSRICFTLAQGADSHDLGSIVSSAGAGTVTGHCRWHLRPSHDVRDPQVPFFVRV